MRPHRVMSLGVAWLVVVTAAWALATSLLTILIMTTASRPSASHAIGQAVVSATFACVVVGGPAAAVVLRARRRHGQRRAALSGAVTAAVVLLFFWSYAAATGARAPSAWEALPPLVVVTGAELWLALRLWRRCQDAGPLRTDEPPKLLAEAHPDQATPGTGTGTAGTGTGGTGTPGTGTSGTGTSGTGAPGSGTPGTATPGTGVARPGRTWPG